MNQQPDFTKSETDVGDALILKNGGEIMEIMQAINASGSFESFECLAYDDCANEYNLECLGYTPYDRNGTVRLYLALRDADDEDQSRWCLYYLVQRGDGIYVLIHEEDEVIHDAVEAFFTGNDAATEEQAAATTEKKKKSGWKIALIIIGFPFWLIWQFIKAILSLLNIGFGDSSAVKAFKNGYNGDSSDMKEYTFINDMGCQQTVYSSDGKTFYNSDGSYAGKSSDGGKTIK